MQQFAQMLWPSMSVSAFVVGKVCSFIILSFCKRFVLSLRGCVFYEEILCSVFVNFKSNASNLHMV